MKINWKEIKLISNKDVNYPFAVLVWVISFLILRFFINLAGFPDSDNKTYTIIELIVSALFAFGDNSTIPILTRKKLLFLGQETGVWLDPGFYFLFWIFSLAEGETQKDERKDTIVEGVKCQDKNGKVMIADANGDWAIGNDEESRQKYLLQPEDKMKTNLESLVKRTLVMVLGGRVYKTHILGQDLGSEILKNPKFIEECGRYGIVYTNMIAVAIAFNMDQEAINSYHEEVLAAQKAKYPTGHKFTHKELQEIEENVQVIIGKARRIITNSALLGRYDVKE